MEMAETDTVIEVHFAGKNFRLTTEHGTDLVAHKIQNGSYEPPLPMILSAMVTRTTGLFLDVGANTGVYSMIASTARMDCQTIAFEPFPPVLDILKRNISINSFSERISIQEIALSDKDGSAPIYLPDQGHNLVETSASLQMGFISGSSPVLEVPTRKLDDIRLPGSISVIKVDIEGFELEFLRGAMKSVDHDRPFIFAEMLSGAAHKFPEITHRLSELGYLAFRMRPDMVILAHWIEFDQHAWNYALVPIEKIHLFRTVCAHHGLEILSRA